MRAWHRTSCRDQIRPLWEVSYRKNGKHQGGGQQDQHASEMVTAVGTPPLQRSSLKELDDEGVVVGFAVAFLDRADNGQDQPGDSHNGVDGKKNKPNNQPPSSPKRVMAAKP